MQMGFSVGVMSRWSSLILNSLGEQRPGAKRSASKLEEYESQMGTVNTRQSPDAPADVQTSSTSPGVYEIANGSAEDEQQMFSMIKKPRVRYDVEVVTRLIVYMGKSISPMRLP